MALTCSEADLVQRATKRDEAAFAELYSHYVEKIYRYIYYKVGDASEAEDLCGQAFLKAWEAIERYTWTGYPFSSWLYRLAHNLVVDHYRTHRESLPLDDTIVTREEPVDPEIALLNSIQAQELRQAIGQLTGEQRQVIHFKFIEGYDNADIARMMNKKEGAIRALQYRALHSLQEIMVQEEQRAAAFVPTFSMA